MSRQNPFVTPGMVEIPLFYRGLNYGNLAIMDMAI
jgi:hypothetical protein